MISISSLFRFLFIFTVLTTSFVGFVFDQPSFVWLAAINASLLLFVSIILRFAKSSVVVPHVKKDIKSFVSDVEEDKENEEGDSDIPVSSKVSHQSHHQQFVKYTYHHKKKKKETSIVWLLALLVVGAFYLIMNRSSTNVVDTDASLSGYSQDVLNQKDSASGAVITGDVIESTGEVLSTGLSSAPTTGISVDQSFVASGETPKTTSTTPVEQTVVLSNSTLKIANTQSVSLLEAIVYLLQTHNTSLYSKKDLKFAGITTKNPYYKYWYTAYKLGLVGSTSSPSTLISCQTYLVLKGMLEKWDVQYTTANVKTQYWAEAEKRDVLNGCVFGKLLKGANLD